MHLGLPFRSSSKTVSLAQNPALPVQPARQNANPKPPLTALQNDCFFRGCTSEKKPLRLNPIGHCPTAPLEAEPEQEKETPVKFGTHGETSGSRGKSPDHQSEARLEDTFFLPLAHRQNPFTEKIHEMEDDPAVRRELKAYGSRLDDSHFAKFSKFALGTSLGFGAYFLSSMTNSTGIGIMAGAAASPFFDDMNRGIVQRWHKPTHRVRQKAALEDLETETQAGALVQQIGTDWPALIESSEASSLTLAPVFSLGRMKRHFADPDETAALIGTALISRYPEQQDALKSTLPKLRETQLARKFILPALQQNTDKHHRGYGACPEEREHPGMRKAVKNMLHLAEQESAVLEQPIALTAEQARYEAHLHHTLPRLIDYLSEE